MFKSAASPLPSVMADEKGGARHREEAPLTKSCLLTHFHFRPMLEKGTSTLLRITSYLQLILSHIDSRPIARNLQKLELGKLAFTVALTATLGLVFSPNFPDAEAHYFVVVGFMVGCAVIWNGILFEMISLQLMGITLNLCLLCFLVGSFLPIAFSWACCLPAALFLIPFIFLVVNPQGAAGGNDA